MKKVTKELNNNEASDPIVKIMGKNTYIDFFEKEGNILLELAKDITRVREKKDLILLFSKRIKSLYYFTHITVTLIDWICKQKVKIKLRRYSVLLY